MVAGAGFDTLIACHVRSPLNGPDSGSERTIRVTVQLTCPTLSSRFNIKHIEEFALEVQIAALQADGIEVS